MIVGLPFVEIAVAAVPAFALPMIRNSSPLSDRVDSAQISTSSGGDPNPEFSSITGTGRTTSYWELS